MSSSSPRASDSSPMTGLASLSLKQSSDGINSSKSRTSEERQIAVNGQDVTASAATTLTLRALVSTKEAGIIIGKAGVNVAQIRERSGVKAGVSKVIPGVHHRVLTVSGSLEGVAKAFSLIVATILENPVVPGTTLNGSSASVDGQMTIRLLISHALMGTVIGRQGLKIKHIQDTAGVRMVASKDMLPSSTERSVEVQGTANGIETAILEIGRCLMDDWERGQGTLLFQPELHTARSGLLIAGREAGLLSVDGRLSTTIGIPNTLLSGSKFRRGGPLPPSRTTPHLIDGNGRGASSAAAVNSGGDLVTSTTDGSMIPAQVIEGEKRIQNISIPSDMVGCIIGKGGSKIAEIRKLSGSTISIAKMTHDESGERMFTIQGTAVSNEKALFLLYNSLELEKKRRAEAAASQAESVEPVAGQQLVEA